MKRLFMACLLTAICFSFTGSAFAVATESNPKTAIDETFVIELPKASPAEEKALAKEKMPKEQTNPVEKKPKKEKTSEKQEISKKEKASVKEKTSEKEKASVKEKAPKKEKGSKKQEISKKQKAPKKEKAPIKQTVSEKQINAKKQNSIRIALLLPSTIDDMAESQAMYEGLITLEKHYAYLNKTTKQKKMPSITITVIERLKGTATKTIHKYAKQGFDLIITHGAQYEKALSTIAPKYPKVSFAYGSGSRAKLPNIFAYELRVQEGAYLLGMLAGFSTKSDIIALVNSAKNESSAKFNQGFIEGVEAVNTKAKVHIADANSSINKASIKKAVIKYIDMKADIISSSGPQSLHVIKAIADSSKALWVGCIGTNPVSIAPKTVLAAQVYDFSQSFETMLTLREENILGGKTIPLNLANDSEYIQYNQGIRSDYMKAFDKAKEAIIKGSLSVAADKAPADKAPADKATAKKQTPKATSTEKATGKASTNQKTK